MFNITSKPAAIAILFIIMSVLAAPVSAESEVLAANELTVTQLIDGLYVQGDTDATETLLSEDFIAHDPINGEMDREDFITFYTAIEIEADTLTAYQLTAGQNLVAQVYADADDAPLMMDFDRYEFGKNGALDTMVNFYRIESGQIAEAWLIYDHISLNNFTGIRTCATRTTGNNGFSGC